MLREKMSFAYIESLIDSLVYFYKSILRLLRKEISNFLIEGHFQKSAYKLLMREDLYANKFLHPSQHIKQLHTDNFSTHHLRHQTNSKLSEVSLQGNLTFGQNEISSNKISTFLCNFQDEKKHPNETSAVQNKHGNPSAITFENPDSQKSIENQAILISKLEKELNLSSQSYSKNLHVSKNDPCFVEIYKLFNYKFEF